MLTGNGHEPEQEIGVEAAVAAVEGGVSVESPHAQRKKFPPHPHITKDILLKHGMYALDFRGEALTFKVRCG